MIASGLITLVCTTLLGCGRDQRDRELLEDSASPNVGQGDQSPTKTNPEDPQDDDPQDDDPQDDDPPPATASCPEEEFLSGGQCVPACQVGELACEADGMRLCVDASSDPEHCGGCHLTCGDGVACVAGQCEEPAPPPRADECVTSDDCSFGRSCLVIEGVAECVHPTCSYQTVAQLGGRPHQADLDGDRLYVPTGTDELYVYDVTEPAEAIPIGHLRLPRGVVQGVDAQDERAVLWTDEQLFVLDVSDPAAMRVQAVLTESPQSTGTNGPAFYGVLTGSMLLHVNASSLLVYDLSDPTSPAARGSYELPQGTFPVTRVQGDRAYLAHANRTPTPVSGSEGGLRILDLSNPDAPTLVGHLPFGDARSLAVQNGLAYLASWETLHTVDLDNEASPAIVDTTDVRCSNVQLQVDGDRLHSGSSCLEIWDLSDPRAPRVATSEGVSHYNNAWEGVLVDGDISYVENWSSGIQVMDRSDPDVIDVQRTLNVLSNARDLALHDTVAYVASPGNVHVVDVIQPTEPSLLGSLSIDAQSLVHRGDTLYVAGSEGLHVLDTRRATQPQQVGFRAVDEGLDHLALCDDFLYATSGVSSEPRRLDVYDVSDRGAPTLVGQLEVPAYPKAVACRGDSVYIMTHDLFLVIDVEDPAEPQLLSETEFSDYRDELIVREGDEVWVVGVGLDVYDVSDREAPELVTRVEGLPRIYGAALDGDLLYAASSTGLDVVNLADLENPRPLGRIVYGSDFDVAQKVAVRDGFAFVVTRRQGLYVADISAEQNPIVLSHLSWDQTDSTNVVLDGTLAYVGGATNSEPGVLRVVDFADSRHPTELSALSTPLAWLSGTLGLQGDVLHLADRDRYTTFDVSNPATPRVLGLLEPFSYLSPMLVTPGRTWVSRAVELATVDTSAPSAPQAGVVIPADPYDSLALLGRLSDGETFLGSGTSPLSEDSDLFAFRISQDDTLDVLGTLPLASTPGALVTDANETLAYLFAWNQIFIVDIRDPSDLRLLSTLEVPNCFGRPNGIALGGGRAYLACRRFIAVVDVSNPLLPRSAHDLHPPSQVDEIALSEHGILVGTHAQGLTFLDPDACTAAN